MSHLQKETDSELAEMMQEECRALAQKMAEEESPSALFSKTQRSQQMEAEAVKTLKTVNESYQEGAKILQDALKEFFPDKYEKVAQELQEVGKNISKENFEEFSKQLQSQNQLRQRSFLMISEESVKVLSATGVHLMKEKRFDDAMKVFLLLCTIEPNLYENWISLGNSSFHAAHYDAALMAYYMAISFRPTSPWPLIWASNACEENKEIEEACTLLQRAKVLIQEYPEKKVPSLSRDIDEKLALLSHSKK